MKRTKKSALFTLYEAEQFAVAKMERDEKAIAEVNTHVVNGEDRHIVHVTYKDHVAKPRTYARAA